MKRFGIFCGVLILILGGARHANAGPTYDFEDVALGTSTPFSDTKGGITASFSSPGDPGGFTIFTSFFAPPMTGHVLFDPGPSGASFIPLDVSFSRALTSVSLDFATDGPGPFMLSAFSGSTLVGVATATGSVPPGFGFPQGSISFSGANFDNIVLESPATPFFAVDNLSVTPIPEPATLCLLAIGTVGLLGQAWRRRKRLGA